MGKEQCDKEGALPQMGGRKEPWSSTQGYLKEQKLGFCTISPLLLCSFGSNVNRLLTYCVLGFC